MSEKALCTICGEPMPPGETMFKFHGYSGDCPKPPLPKPPLPYVVERHDQQDGSITYEIWDHRAASYRRLCSLNEELDGDGTARADAEMIARTLNASTPTGRPEGP